MTWRDPDDLPSTDKAEVVIRLMADVMAHPRKDDQVYWWGRSVHQIAMVDSEGTIRVNNRVVELAAIDGWLELPK